MIAFSIVAELLRGFGIFFVDDLLGSDGHVDDIGRFGVKATVYVS